MLLNFLKLTLRLLWRNRIFTLLNVLGLSIGLSAAWIMYQYTSYEFSYDTGHENAGRMYRVSSRFLMDGSESGNTGTPMPLAKHAPEIPGVELAIPVFEQGMSSVLPENGTVVESPKNLVATSSQYFQFVRYQWLAGNPATAMTQPDQVVLTKSRAARYFPGLTPEQVTGRMLTYNDTLVYRVSGVVADLGYPSHFTGQEFRRWKPEKIVGEAWGGVSSNNELFLLLAENASPSDVLDRINRLSDDNSREKLAQWNMKRWHVLIPVSDIHFAGDYGGSARTANKKVLFVLSGIAGFLLLLACINYINLATAQIPQRAREIGIRKTLGSSRGAILRDFLGETMLVTSLAAAFSVVLTRAFFHFYADMLPEEVLKYAQPEQTVQFLAGLVLAVSLVSGIYPAWLTMRAQPVQVLRGHTDTRRGSGGITLRKSLIVFQFGIAQLFIAGAVIVGQQLHFLLHKDLGFEREAVVLVEVPWKLTLQPEYKEKHFTLAEEWKKLPGVATVALGEPLFSGSYSSNTHTRVNEKGEEVMRNLYRKYADPGVIPLYNVPLLAGRNLRMSDTVQEYVINETAVKEFGFASPQAAVGQFLKEAGSDFAVPVVGVVADFHTLSFSEKIEPVAFMCNKEGLENLNIKLASRRPADWQPVLRDLEAGWKAFYPSEPFKYSFYDETLKATYESETGMARIINLATGVALLISCLGLFGLAAFMARRRTKEIGIRKVMGASVASVLRLLSGDFLLLVLVAFALSAPVAWYLSQQWLEHYTYRIEIQWWMFAATGLAAAGMSLLTISFQSLRAALANPVDTLRNE
jgi:putative ABC transport system permease protein